MSNEPRSIRFDLMLIADPAIESEVEALFAIIETAPIDRVAVQLRSSEGGAATLLDAALKLRGITRDRGIPLLINDRVDVALLANADGVHLKENGVEIEDARALLGPGRIVGASCHDALGLTRRSNADYVVLGPFADVPGKNPPLGTDAFAALARNAPMPIFALGGIDASNARAAIAAGASGVACARAVFGVPEPKTAVSQLLSIIDQARAASPLI